MNIKKLKNLSWEDVDFNDYPDFCDALISYAEHEDGTPLTEDELEELNEDDEKYELLMEYLY